MGYYTVPLEEESKKYTAFVLPWGKYEYNKLPMGISPAVELFQHKIDEVFQDIEKAKTYLDDILIVTHGDEQDQRGVLQ